MVLPRTTSTRPRRLLLLSVVLLQWAAIEASSVEPLTVHVRTMPELQQAGRLAKPGTTIQIAPGRYEGTLHFSTLRGTAESRIVLTAADPKNPPVFGGERSGLHLSKPSYVELHHLVFEEPPGNGINIDDGGSLDTPAQGLVLRDVTLRGKGVAGNRDGFKLSGLDNFRIESCTIERWGDNGSGIDMVGCHNGVIRNCTFRYRGDIGANGVQAKGGSSNIVIQRCRFESAGGRSVNLGGSTGLPYFRPPSAAYEAKNLTVEDCTFIGCTAPICFVGVDGATVRYNTIYRPRRYVAQILQENTAPRFVPSRNGRFTHNIIAFRLDELRGGFNVGAGTAPETFTFANNHWYCLDRPQSSHRLALPTPELDGIYGIDPQFIHAERGDVRLKNTSPAHEAGVRPVKD